MLQALYDYFNSVVIAIQGNTFLGYGFDNISSITIFGATLKFSQYFALLLALVALIIIFVLCCLFIYRLIRLVGRLFSGGAL